MRGLCSDDLALNGKMGKMHQISMAKHLYLEQGPTGSENVNMYMYGTT